MLLHLRRREEAMGIIVDPEKLPIAIMQKLDCADFTIEHFYTLRSGGDTRTFLEIAVSDTHPCRGMDHTRSTAMHLPALIVL